MKYGLKKLYINGELKEASDSKVFDLVCPGNEEIIGQIAWASKSDTQEALEAAKEGFKFWSKLPLEERLDWIGKLRNKLIANRERLRESIMFEMGKTWEGTEEDLTSIVNSLEYYPEEIRKRTTLAIPDKEGTHEHQLLSQPLGVCVAFLAYNFPLLNLGFKLGPALAAGCSIIIKPSEFSSLSAYMVGEICEEINFPKGVINVLCGDIENVGMPLCESTIPQLITMIGSTETAQKLIQQSSKTSIKRYSMECGGNAPFIVMADADLKLAVQVGAALKIGNAGQICVAPNRFFVHETVFDEYLEGIKKKFESTILGFGRENAPDMGPLANKASLTKVKQFVDTALQQGGELLTGGKSKDQVGFYFEPTLIKLTNPYAEILQEEVFGPVAVVIPFSTKEEVLGYANNTNAGLASYVFSSDQSTVNYFVENLEFGEVQVNGVKYDIYLPHGGIKNSGIGVDCSTYALDDYLIKKRVSKALT